MDQNTTQPTFIGALEIANLNYFYRKWTPFLTVVPICSSFIFDGIAAAASIRVMPVPGTPPYLVLPPFYDIFPPVSLEVNPICDRSLLNSLINVVGRSWMSTEIS